MNQLSRSLSAVVLMSSVMVACGSHDSGVSAVGPAIVGTSVAPADLKPVRHDSAQCPRGIQGSWATRNKNRTISRATYAFQGATLVRTDAESLLVYDGTVRQMTPNAEMIKSGARLWYVGGCRKQKLVEKMHATGPRATLMKREESILRRGRIETMGVIDSDGYAVSSDYVSTRTAL